MATTFDIFYLGTASSIDPTEGNQTSENAGSLVGNTYGTSGGPLHQSVRTWSPGSYGGGTAGVYDTNNSASNDTFRIDGGSLRTLDSTVTYNTTITYVDGTTANITAVVAQDTAGRLYLMPELTYNSDQAALEAKPIQSIRFNSLNADTGDLAAERVAASYATVVDGTSGNDSMGSGYTDAQGDQIDGADGNNDYINAGAGNDTVIGGAGNDTIYGGTGDDSIGDWGLESGNDSIRGGDGNDTIIAGGGDDTVHGDAGDDYISGAGGNDMLYGGDGSDLFAISDDHDGDTIDGGSGGSNFDQVAFWDVVSTGGVSVSFSGNGAGTYSFNGTTGSGAFNNIEAIYASQHDDIIDASATSSWIVIASGDGNDVIIGGSGTDYLYGQGGSDTIDGGAGSDEISGGTGDDRLTGGGGADRFVYSVGDGHDTIVDFNFGNTGTLNDGSTANNDYIDLSGYYDHISELYADQADDGILNQSNSFNTRGEAVDYSDNSQFGAGDSLTFQGASADSSYYTAENTGVVCFTPGIRIVTERGLVPVETIRLGDRVQTADAGFQPVVWIGARVVEEKELAASPNLKPILIKPGSMLGNAVPLLVSPQHRFVLRGDQLGDMRDVQEAFIRAKFLPELRRSGVRVAHGIRRVTYIHLMTESHQVIFADGVATETFWPGEQALRALEPAARHELLSLFPELGAELARRPAGFNPLARMPLKRHHLVGLQPAI